MCGQTGIGPFAGPVHGGSDRPQARGPLRIVRPSGGGTAGRGGPTNRCPLRAVLWGKRPPLVAGGNEESNGGANRAARPGHFPIRTYNLCRVWQLSRPVRLAPSRREKLGRLEAGPGRVKTAEPL